jgi:hypothetical protein
MPLRFNDGVVLETYGELRKVELADGWYILGGGMSLPCEDEAQASRILDYLLTCRDRKEGVI